MIPSIHHQLHGYRSGHQLLHSSVRLDRRDQDLIDRLSDMAGPLRPGECFSPYLSCYPLPSEEYYVLSRTRQDVEAPRAGCVVTQTLLIPMPYWEAKAHLPELIELFDAEIPDEAPIVINELQRSLLPDVKSKTISELLEALFLEKRVPIVVFGADDAEALIVRLITALWPAMRRKFSACTLSLAPRMLSGRPFDLLFAPKAARARFSEWPGRRIDASGKESQARHRWTSALVQRVFEGQSPSLMSPDTERLLASGNGDESSLRLSLLWEELLEKSNYSPAAALGLLDIANSKRILAESWKAIAPGLLRALDSFLYNGDGESAWAFIRDMSAKLGAAPESALAPILSKIATLASHDVKPALTSLAKAAPNSILFSPNLLHAVATTINADNLKHVANDLANLAPARLIFLLSLNPKLLLLTNPDVKTPPLKIINENLYRATTELSTQRRQAYLKTFLPFIKKEEQAALLEELLKDSDSEAVVDTAKAAWNNSLPTELRVVLCRAAHFADTQEAVRNIIAERYCNNRDINYILQLLDYTQHGTEWILSSQATEQYRCDLLRAYIGMATPNQLTIAFTDMKHIDTAVSLLIRAAKSNAKPIASLLSSKAASAKTATKATPKIYAYLSHSEREHLLRKTLDKLMSDDSLLQEHLPILASSLPDQLNLDLIFQSGRSHSTQYFHIHDLLSTLDKIDDLDLKISEENLDILTDWITSRAHTDLNSESASMIVKILDKLEHDNHRLFEQVALELLPSLMISYEVPASILIAKSFPAVYDMLREEESGLKFSRIFSFTDWDKCKTARKGLVRSFLKSKWHPEDLAKTAYSARDTRRIFKELASEPGGKSYLRLIELNSKSLEPGCRREVLSEIHRIGPSEFQP